MNILKNTFGKEEKLCSEKDIDALYKSGSSFLIHPVVVYYAEKPALKNTQVLVSVSKKKFKRAVDRNLLKRRLREAYRLNKHVLQKKHHLALVYIGNEQAPFTLIQHAVTEALKRIQTGQVSSR